MPICKAGFLVKGHKQYPYAIKRSLHNGDKYFIMQSFDEYDRELSYKKEDGQWVRRTKRSDTKSQPIKLFDSIEDVTKDIHKNMEGDNVEIIKDISMSLHVL